MYTTWPRTPTGSQFRYIPIIRAHTLILSTHAHIFYYICRYRLYILLSFLNIGEYMCIIICEKDRADPLGRLPPSRHRRIRNVAAGHARARGRLYYIWFLPGGLLQAKDCKLYVPEAIIMMICARITWYPRSNTHNKYNIL